MVEELVRAVRRGRPVILPTDTVYGLCCTPHDDGAARRISRLKGRDELQPLALLACDLDALLDSVPELRGRTGTIARELLPGPYTLVVPNPARRFGWLPGSRPDTLGVRVPLLHGDAKTAVERLRIVVATSANRTGEPDPRRLDEVPEEIRRACDAVLDGGDLPGVPSTVLDLTGPEPVVLRAGAVPAAEALERVRAALS